MRREAERPVGKVRDASGNSLLAEVLCRYESELAAGAIVAVDEARMRVRVLPLT